MAGDHRIVFVCRGPLVFVAVAKSRLSENQVRSIVWLSPLSFPSFSSSLSFPPPLSGTLSLLQYYDGAYVSSHKCI